MNIFFQDPSDVPLPPEQVRIREFRAEPWPDGRRVRITLEITPFLKRPNGEISVTDASGTEVSSLSIIETMVHKMEFTIHLRSPETGGRYLAAATLFYLEEEQTSDEEPEQPLEDREQIVVDRAETVFEIRSQDQQS